MKAKPQTLIVGRYTYIISDATSDRELKAIAEKHPHLVGKHLFLDGDNSNTESADDKAKPKQVESKPKRKRKSSSK